MWSRLSSKLLAVRSEYAAHHLADLYDSIAMPSELRRAHSETDKVVAAAFSRKKLITDADRQKVLFERYEKLAASL